MRVLPHGFRVVRRWIPLLVALQFCGFASAAASWVPSGGASAASGLVRAVAVPAVTTPTSRRGLEEAPPTADGTRGFALRDRAAGPPPSDAAVLVTSVADVPVTVMTQGAALGSVAVPAQRPAAPAVHTEIDARGPPCGGVFTSVVPPTRSTG